MITNERILQEKEAESACFAVCCDYQEKKKINRVG